MIPHVKDGVPEMETWEFEAWQDKVLFPYIYLTALHMKLVKLILELRKISRKKTEVKKTEEK